MRPGPIYVPSMAISLFALITIGLCSLLLGHSNQHHQMMSSLYMYARFVSLKRIILLKVVPDN